MTAIPNGDQGLGFNLVNLSKALMLQYGQLIIFGVAFAFAFACGVEHDGDCVLLRRLFRRTDECLLGTLGRTRRAPRRRQQGNVAPSCRT